MLKKWQCNLFISLALFLILFTRCIHADPPTRVARLGFFSGTLSFLPSKLNEWVEATQNWPLTIGDSLWLDKDGRAELQLGTAAICLSANTNVSILNLDNNIAQFQLKEGKLFLRVKKISSNQEYEIDTPNLAFLIKKPGYYKIEVDSIGNTTTVTTHQGEAAVYGEGNAYIIRANQTYRFLGTDLNDYQLLDYRKNEFDTWCINREPKRMSYHYVASELIGSEDLENNGKWVNIETYGNVWKPTNVPEDWAPYHYGHWAFIDPWGWTWIALESWGFAPFHYGRWINYNNHWYWIPGKTEKEAIYSPALVGFLSINSNIAWFPLSDNEFYWPSYPISSEYFVAINSNINLKASQLLELYNKKYKTQKYANMVIPNSIITLSKTAFINSQMVSNKPIERLSKLSRTRSLSSVSIKPNRMSFIANAKPTNIKPPIFPENPIIIKNKLPNEDNKSKQFLSSKFFKNMSNTIKKQQVIVITPPSPKLPPKISPARKLREAKKNGQNLPVVKEQPALTKEERKKRWELREQRTAPPPFDEQLIKSNRRRNSKPVKPLIEGQQDETKDNTHENHILPEDHKQPSKSTKMKQGKSNSKKIIEDNRNEVFQQSNF